jgi:hypothetical protein
MLLSTVSSACLAQLPGAIGSPSVRGLKTDSTTQGRTIWSRSIQLPPLSGESLIEIPLDPAVYSALDDGRWTLRIIRNNADLVPFLLRPRMQTQTIDKEPPFVLPRLCKRGPIENFGDGAVEFDIELSPGEPAADRIRFWAETREHEQQVTVWAYREDGLTPIVQGAVIFDYYRLLPGLVANWVPLPEVADRKFRVRVEALPAEQSPRFDLRPGSEIPEANLDAHQLDTAPWLVSDAKLAGRWKNAVAEEQVVLASRAAKDLTVELDVQKRRTLLRFSSGPEILFRLKLQTESRNFSRRVRLERLILKGSQPVDELDDRNWSKITETEFSRYQLRQLQSDELEIQSLLEWPGRLRLVIDDGDFPPLDIQELDLTYGDWRIWCLASPGDQLRLEHHASEYVPPDILMAGEDQPELTRLNSMMWGTASASMALLGPVKLASKSLVEKVQSSLNRTSGLLLLAVAVVAILAGREYARRRVPRRRSDGAAEESGADPSSRS